jgi:hypothetical protein
VKPHPDLLLGAESAWQPSASKEARMNQPPQELHLGERELLEVLDLRDADADQA